MTEKEFISNFISTIFNQVTEFQETLPDNERVGIVINGGIIVIDSLEALPSVGLIGIRGRYSTATPPLEKGQNVRVLMKLNLQYLTLTSVPNNEPKMRRPVGIVGLNLKAAKE